MQRLSICTSESDDSPSRDEKSGFEYTLLGRHAEWLPAMAKWGGVANPAVRRHWCTCVAALLDSIQTHAGQLTIREMRIFESLLARRDLWTDDQVCAISLATLFDRTWNLHNCHCDFLLQFTYFLDFRPFLMFCVFVQSPAVDSGQSLGSSWIGQSRFNLSCRSWWLRKSWGSILGLSTFHS